MVTRRVQVPVRYGGRRARSPFLQGDAAWIERVSWGPPQQLLFGLALLAGAATPGFITEAGGPWLFEWASISSDGAQTGIFSGVQFWVMPNRFNPQVPPAGGYQIGGMLFTTTTWLMPLNRVVFDRGVRLMFYAINAGAGTVQCRMHFSVREAVAGEELSNPLGGSLPRRCCRG